MKFHFFIKAMRTRLENVVIFVACILYYLIRGNARAHVAPRRIVVIQNAKLGDMVCTTPVFRALKKNLPNSRLTVIGNRINGEVVKGNTDIDHYLVFENNFLSVLRALWQEKNDAAILTTPNFQSLALLYLSGCPLVVSPSVIGGYSPWETRLYRIIKKFTVICEHRMGSYAPGEYLKLLKPLGIIETDTTKHLVYSEEALKRIQKIVSESGVGPNDFLLGISVSSGNKIKNWGAHKFAELMYKISLVHQVTFVLIGGKVDELEVKETLQMLDRSVSISNLAGRLTIDELKALISSLDLFLSVDTGPIYIAEAFKIPTVDIVGPVDEREQPPAGEFHKVIVPKRKEAAVHIMNARIYDTAEARRQTESISVEDVLEPTLELVARVL